MKKFFKMDRTLKNIYKAIITLEKDLCTLLKI